MDKKIPTELLQNHYYKTNDKPELARVNIPKLTEMAEESENVVIKFLKCSDAKTKATNNIHQI